MTPASELRLPDDVIDAAIIWGVKLDYSDPTPETRSEFQRWLEADPRHAIAWTRIRSFKTTFSQLPPVLARNTLDSAQNKHRMRDQGRRGALKLLSLSGLAALLSWTGYEELPWQRLLADASTGTGEQKTLRLDDGTIVVLNTDSAISIDLSGSRRRIVLRRGEILLTTGADQGVAAKRPFWVYTPFGKMQALGTRFVVRLDQGAARISVQEGAVELHPARGGASVIVQPGQSRWLTDEQTTPATNTGLAADGFAEGVMSGQNIRLADLLHELSRYRHGRIMCDKRVAELRVSGLFHVRDTDQVLQFLLQTQPISVTYRTRFWITVGPADVS
ncbi:FecR domain-containing protein [Herbaspirillum autotrophicum]|uniref:FecR domain-containing protein n=1 Tax=Herbaspirillum autotrophicum TaxID=180195 RepID=UPI00067E2414|nr:FecR domain-containing protein [Herbaspirillum autotrophicum]